MREASPPDVTASPSAPPPPQSCSASVSHGLVAVERRVAPKMVDDARRWGPSLLEDGTYLDRPRPSWRYPAVVGAVGLAALGATAFALEDERWTIAAVALGALFAV